MSSMCSGAVQVERPSQAMVMFQEAINKSFEIIKTMLPRLNSLYQLNEELERSVSNVERKLTKLELDNEDLHYELRTNKLALETRITSLIAQYNALVNDSCSSRRQTDGGGKGKGRHAAEKKEEEYESPDGRSSKPKDRTRKIIFEDEVVRKEGKEGKENREVKQARKNSLKRRNSIQLEEDQTGEAKVTFNISHASIDFSDKNIAFNSEKSVFGSEHSVNRKSNMKIKRQEPSNGRSAKLIKRKKQERDSQNYASFLREIQNYHFHNQKMKKNYEKLMDQYCHQNNVQFTALKQQIDQITSKLQQIDPQNNLLDLIQKNSHLQLTQNLEEFKNRLNSKLDASIFEGVFKDFSGRLGSAHESIRKLANKEETRRAIEYLQNKIQSKLNFVMGEQQAPRKKENQSVHTVDIGIKGCLKSVSSSQDHTRELSQHNSKQTLRGQPTGNLPRTARNEQRVKAKRIVTSLHSHFIDAAQTDDRDNQARLSLILQKSDKLEEVTTKVIRNSMMQREVNLLKQKSMAALNIGKTKLKPRLKKQRLIFQYD